MASSRINVLCVTDSGEVRQEKAVVRTEDYDTFLICGDRKERLANAQHAIIRDVSGTTHPVIVWDDGSCEDGDGDHDHSHPVYALLVPRSIYTVDCPVAGNIVITGQGTNIPNGDTSDSENENEEWHARVYAPPPQSVLALANKKRSQEDADDRASPKRRCAAEEDESETSESGSGSESESESDEDDFFCAECQMPGSPVAPGEEVCAACSVF